MSSPSKFAHIVYRTRHIDKMIEWYTAALGCKIRHRNDKLAFLSYDDEHHRIAILDIGRPGDDDKTGLEAMGPALMRKEAGVQHVAYTWDTLGELMDTYKRMKERGVVPVWNIKHGLTLSMYYADPDGNCAEFQVDVLSLKDAAEFMESPAFAANPVGDRFDPEDILAGIEAKKPLEELLLRKDQTPPAGGIAVTLN